MALSGSRLQTALATDILTQLQSAFPISGSLLPAEQTKLQAAQQSMASAMAAAIGPDTVSEITGHATVTGVQTGAGTAVVT